MITVDNLSHSFGFAFLANRVKLRFFSGCCRQPLFFYSFILMFSLDCFAAAAEKEKNRQNLCDVIRRIVEYS